MSAQLSRLGIDFRRFDAIDGSNLELGPDAVLTPGETACHRSHRACWQELIDSGEKLALVLEDDLLISPRLAKFLAYPEHWPTDADIIRLETFGQLAYLSTRNIKAPAGVRLHRLLTDQYGAGAYVISRKCAIRLLREDQSNQVPVDTMIYRRASPTGDLIIYQADPALCIQGKVHLDRPGRYSDIEPLRSLRYARLPTPEPAPLPTGFARIVHEAKRFGRPLYRFWVFGDRERRIEFDRYGDPAPGVSSRGRFA